MKSIVDIGTRTELFVDDWLVEETNGASLRLHPPEKREVALTTDQPWEGADAAYFTVLRDGATVRLYYRGNGRRADNSADQVTCLAESADGIHFTRPELGLYEVNGSRANNIIWKGLESHNLCPFIDSNPACPPDQRYKAVGNWGTVENTPKLAGLVSADGVHWRRIQDAPLEIAGVFDSLNVAFYDLRAGCYRAFVRYFTQRTRAIQSCTSQDFIHWTAPTPHRYAEGVPLEHFYTNATVPCPGAEHILLSFPMRFVPDRHPQKEAHPWPGVSDAVFMTSRDGVNWDRTFREAWVRPGRDARNWTERSNMPAWGIIETAAGEFSMYISEHYRWPDHRLRRLVISRHRFASLHGGVAGGECTTRPLRFSGRNLLLNYATSAPGSILVEVQDEAGRPIPGYSLADAAPIYGDELDGPATWKGGDLSSLAGRPVRFRLVLRDADVFALRTQ